jgi:hypothetical protein
MQSYLATTLTGDGESDDTVRVGGAAQASAVLSLPPEILAEVFLRMPLEQDTHLRTPEIPLLLGQVCLYWRAIAWSTPALWSNVNLRLSKERYSVQTELLDEWLQRSKAVPLTIRIWSGEQECGYWQSITPTEMLRILVSHSWHWKSVNLYAPHQWDEDLQPVRDNLPMLDTLRVTHPTIAEDRSFDMFENAPSLHEVDLISVYVAEVTLPWHQITTFRGDRLYVDECLKVLWYCPQMKKCYFSPIIGDYDLERAHLWPKALTHESLERLDITMTDISIIDPFLDLCTLPALRRLRIGCNSRVVGATVSIMPAIRRSACILEKLSMEQAFLSVEEAISCLQDIPSLVTLQISIQSPKKISVKFLSALSSTHKPLLPNLRSLRLEGYVSFNGEQLMEMLVCRWTYPEKLSCSVARLKSLKVISSNNSAFSSCTEGYHRRLLEMVQDGLDLSIVSSDGADFLKQMGLRIAEESNRS